MQDIYPPKQKRKRDSNCCGKMDPHQRLLHFERDLTRTREADLDELSFLVKGSAADPYEATFIKDGDSLTALCTCPAGQFGNFCKHRIAILDGDAKGIVSDNANRVSTIVEWLKGTDVALALAEFRNVEQDGGASKSTLAAAKKKLARAMNS